MKEGLSQQIYQMLGRIMLFYEQLPDNKFDNIDEINKFLTKTHSRRKGKLGWPYIY